MSQDGNYSPTVASMFLKNIGVPSSTIRVTDLNFKSGTYLLATTTQGIEHSVALVDGILFDSLKSAPIELKGKLPSEYRLNNAIEIGGKEKREEVIEIL